MGRAIASLIFLFHIFPTFAVEISFDEMKFHAEKGDHHAQFLIGFSYQIGNYYDVMTIDKNPDEALKWILLSAEGGFSYAQFHLGGMYLQGKGVEQDDVMAAKWFLEGAKNGDIQACVNIAILYFEGRGVKQDLEKAYAWGSLAAFKNNKNAKSLIQAVLPKLQDRENADLLAAEYFKKYAEGGLGE